MLIGNLGVDPELKFTQSGKALLRMRLATTERFGTGEGQREERTEWHTVILWGNRAEALGKFLGKGHKLYIEGRLQTREWEAQDGGKRSTTEINAHEVLILGGGQRGEGGGQQGGGYGGQGSRGSSQRGAGQHREEKAPRSKGNDFPPEDFGDDDIPF